MGIFLSCWRMALSSRFGRRQSEQQSSCLRVPQQLLERRSFGRVHTYWSKLGTWVHVCHVQVGLVSAVFTPYTWRLWQCKVGTHPSQHSVTLARFWRRVWNPSIRNILPQWADALGLEIRGLHCVRASVPIDALGVGLQPFRLQYHAIQRSFSKSGRWAQFISYAGSLVIVVSNQDYLSILRTDGPRQHDQALLLRKFVSPCRNETLYSVSRDLGTLRDFCDHVLREHMMVGLQNSAG